MTFEQRRARSPFDDTGQAVAIAPRNNSALVRTGPPEASDARRFLQRVLPHSWRFAHHMATDLARQIEYLPWSGRVETFDTYFLRQAEAMLRPNGLSELFGGRPAPAGPPHGPRQLEGRCDRFADWSRIMVTAVLLDLGERVEVMAAEQGLTYLLTRDLGYAKAAAVWTAFHGMSTIVQVLHGLPGYALVLLAVSRNDTADRFMARDAFWAAVMARS
jgi:hypothetical protein